MREQKEAAGRRNEGVRRMGGRKSNVYIQSRNITLLLNLSILALGEWEKEQLIWTNG